MEKIECLFLVRFCFYSETVIRRRREVRDQGASKFCAGFGFGNLNRPLAPQFILPLD